MNNDYGFENRKAFLERSRDERFLNKLKEKPVSNPHMPKSVIALHKQDKLANNNIMRNMHKENFNRNFNRNI